MFSGALLLAQIWYRSGVKVKRALNPIAYSSRDVNHMSLGMVGQQTKSQARSTPV